MRLSYSLVAKRPALLHRLTGLTVAEFEGLCEQFASQYDLLVIQPRVTATHRVRALGGGQKGALPEVADKLFFILLYSRIYPLLIVQGMFFGIAESKACKWVGILLPVLRCQLRSSSRTTQASEGTIPRRDYRSVPRVARTGSPHRRNGATPFADPKSLRSRKKTTPARRSAIPRSTSPSRTHRPNTSWPPAKKLLAAHMIRSFSTSRI